MRYRIFRSDDATIEIVTGGYYILTVSPGIDADAVAESQGFYVEHQIRDSNSYQIARV